MLSSSAIPTINRLLQTLEKVQKCRKDISKPTFKVFWCAFQAYQMFIYQSAQVLCLKGFLNESVAGFFNKVTLMFLNVAKQFTIWIEQQRITQNLKHNNNNINIGNNNNTKIKYKKLEQSFEKNIENDRSKSNHSVASNNLFAANEGTNILQQRQNTQQSTISKNSVSHFYQAHSRYGFRRNNIVLSLKISNKQIDFHGNLQRVPFIKASQMLHTMDYNAQFYRQRQIVRFRLLEGQQYEEQQNQKHFKASQTLSSDALQKQLQLMSLKGVHSRQLVNEVAEFIQKKTQNLRKFLQVKAMQIGDIQASKNAQSALSELLFQGQKRKQTINQLYRNLISRRSKYKSLAAKYVQAQIQTELDLAYFTSNNSNTHQSTNSSDNHQKTQRKPNKKMNYIKIVADLNSQINKLNQQRVSLTSQLQIQRNKSNQLQISLNNLKLSHNTNSVYCQTIIEYNSNSNQELVIAKVNRKESSVIDEQQNIHRSQLQNVFKVQNKRTVRISHSALNTPKQQETTTTITKNRLRNGITRSLSTAQLSTGTFISKSKHLKQDFSKTSSSSKSAFHSDHKKLTNNGRRHALSRSASSYNHFNISSLEQAVNQTNINNFNSHDNTYRNQHQYDSNNSNQYTSSLLNKKMLVKPRWNKKIIDQNNNISTSKQIIIEESYNIYEQQEFNDKTFFGNQKLLKLVFLSWQNALSQEYMSCRPLKQALKLVRTNPIQPSNELITAYKTLRNLPYWKSLSCFLTYPNWCTTKTNDKNQFIREDQAKLQPSLTEVQLGKIFERIRKLHQSCSSHQNQHSICNHLKIFFSKLGIHMPSFSNINNNSSQLFTRTNVFNLSLQQKNNKIIKQL